MSAGPLSATYWLSDLARFALSLYYKHKETMKYWGWNYRLPVTVPSTDNKLSFVSFSQPPIPHSTYFHLHFFPLSLFVLASKI